MDTAAVEGVVGEADDVPRTITCRSVDLSAAKRCDGGAGCERASALSRHTRTYRRRRIDT